MELCEEDSSPSCDEGASLDDFVVLSELTACASSEEDETNQQVINEPAATCQYDSYVNESC